MIQALWWLALAVGLASALLIAVDVGALGRRQPMWVMNVVHPVTALYLGPIWVLAYARRWRAPAVEPQHDEPEGPVGQAEVANAVSHCGAGCTLGDILGGWLVFAFGVTILGERLFAEYALDLALAWSLGVLFQYLTIAPMRNLSFRHGLVTAAKVDTLSILAFEVGLFGWMAVSSKILFEPELSIASPGHWAMMQLGMILGFATAWPVNHWLLARGTKERMGAPTTEKASTSSEAERAPKRWAA